MPLSEENRRLVEAVYGRDNCSTILRMLSARGFTLDRLLNAARAEERAKAEAEIAKLKTDLAVARIHVPRPPILETARSSAFKDTAPISRPARS